MIRRELLDALEGFAPDEWSGTTFRHVLGETPPEKENTRGARWNPPETAAIYVSMERATAIAEGDHLLDMQTPRPYVRRTVYTVEVALTNVLDLSAPGALASVGLGEDALRGDDHTACQEVGEAAAWLGHDGLFVPSARAPGANLVVYPTNFGPDAAFIARESEVIDPGPEA